MHRDDIHVLIMEFCFFSIMMATSSFASQTPVEPWVIPAVGCFGTGFTFAMMKYRDRQLARMEADQKDLEQGPPA